MKKISFSAVAVLLAGSLMCSSCIGSFKLFNGYEKWQCNMTSNKYVNGIVGLILQPIVGGICLLDRQQPTGCEQGTDSKGSGWSLLCRQDSEERLRGEGS